MSAERRSIVCPRSQEAVSRARSSGDINAIAPPLDANRRAVLAGGADGKCRGALFLNCHVSRLLADCDVACGAGQHKPPKTAPADRSQRIGRALQASRDLRVITTSAFLI